MTTLILIRHAEADGTGRRLYGRLPGIALNARGRGQALRSARRLAAAARIAAVYSSPLERARATAVPLAALLGLEVRIHAGLDEADFGAWTGRDFAALRKDDEWRAYNADRGAVTPPGGEPADATRARVAAALRDIASRHPEDCVAVVSHGDPIRYALADFLGLSPGAIHRLQVDPASASTIALDPGGARVLCINHDGSLPLG